MSKSVEEIREEVHEKNVKRTKERIRESKKKWLQQAYCTSKNDR